MQILTEKNTVLSQELEECKAQLEAAESQPEDTSTVLTLFETFASNNMRKRTLRSLAEVYQVATINP